MVITPPDCDLKRESDGNHKLDYGTRGVRLQLLGVALVLGKLSGKDGDHK